MIDYLYLLHYLFQYLYLKIYDQIKNYNLDN